MNCAGKVVIVTGAASGIGAATARKFAQLSASLVLVDVNERELKNVGDDCGDQTLLIRADIADNADVSRVIERTISHYGRLDVLANVAGIFQGSNIDNATMEHFDSIFAVNTRGLFNLTTRCIPYLIETRGAIVSVSSAATRRVVPAGHVYGMSKSAVDFMTKSFAVELAPRGVRVNAVNPGPIDTNIANPDRLPEVRKQMQEIGAQNVPLGRVGRPCEVASVIVFLASELASFVTGVTVPVDGAFRLHAEFKMQEKLSSIK